MHRLYNFNLDKKHSELLIAPIPGITEKSTQVIHNIATQNRIADTTSLGKVLKESFIIR